MRKTKILVVTNTFLPKPRGRTERLLAVFKNMTRFSWTPIVLTPTGRVGRIDRVRGYEGTIINIVPRNNKGFANWLNKLMSGIFFSIRLLDQFTPNVYRAVISTLYLIRTKKINCLYTLSQPFSLHLVGLLAKKMTKVFWVVDFRDPWVFNKNYFPQGAPFWHKMLERATIKNADLVLYHLGMQMPEGYLENKYGEFSEKIKQVPVYGFGGVDLEKVRSIPANASIRNGNEFLLVYAGAFYPPTMRPDELLQAMKYLLDDSGRQVRLIVLGQWDKAHAKAAQKWGVAQYVDSPGWVPYEVAVGFMKAADALVFIGRGLEGDERNIPQKFADYVAIGKPILALTPQETAMWELITKHRLGLCSDPKDVGSIKSNISRLMNREVVEPRVSGVEIDARRAAAFMDAEIAQRMNSTASAENG